MAYAVSSCVAAICPHLISGASDFSSSTSPTQGQVNSWLSSGSSIIDTKLAARGYSPIGTTSAAYEMAAAINIDYGVYRAELSRLSARVSKMENSRADVFEKAFWKGLEALCSLDLSLLGVGRTGAFPNLYTGGISADDKSDNEADDDVVQPRFARGQFRNPETLEPSQITNRNQTRADEE